MEQAPASRPARPVIKIPCDDSSAPATPMIKLKFGTRPSLAPSTAARKAVATNRTMAPFEPGHRAALDAAARWADNGAKEARVRALVSGQLRAPRSQWPAV